MNASNDTLALVERRSNRLVRALTRLGLRPGHRLAVMCCDDHFDDALTAHLTATKGGAISLTIGIDQDPADLAAQFRADPVQFVLACAEGAAQWEQCGSRGVLVADAANAYWWPMLENRESDDPVPMLSCATSAPGSAPTPELNPTSPAAELAYAGPATRVTGGRST